MDCAIESIISTDLLDDKKKTTYDEKKFGAIPSASTHNGRGSYYKTGNNLRDSSGSRCRNPSQQSRPTLSSPNGPPWFLWWQPVGREEKSTLSNRISKSEMKAAGIDVSKCPTQSVRGAAASRRARGFPFSRFFKQDTGRQRPHSKNSITERRPPRGSSVAEAVMSTS